MKEMSIQSVAEVLGAEVRWSRPHADDAGGIFSGVTIDSRTVKAGDCFFAIVGEHFDGHDYVEDVLAKGAVCAVVSKHTGIKIPVGKALLVVSDTIKALGDLARAYRQSGDFKVVAITGSVGKTTTRLIVSHVLGARFRIHQSPKSFNNDIGVPLTLLGAEPDTEIVVAELGSNHLGEIGYLTGIALPDIAVVTNVHPTHLEGFGSLEAIVKEKLSISAGLRGKGVLIVNGDHAQLVDASQDIKATVRTFGAKAGCDCSVEQIRCEGIMSRFKIEGREIRFGLPGRGNVENATAAWAVCHELGMSVDEYASALATMPAVSMRTEILSIGSLNVLNDCYNANPASMRNALEILKNMEPKDGSKRVFVCGDMAELGKQSEQLHKELGECIAKAGVDLVLSIGGLARIAAQEAKKQAESGVGKGEQGVIRTECFDNVDSACDNLHEFIGNYDIVLVKGSRSAGLEKIVEQLKKDFSQGTIE